MLKFFRYQRNRRLLHGVILLVITAWLALSLTSACAFPPQYYAKASPSDCMSAMAMEEHSSDEHTASMPEDCLKSCLTDQAKNGLGLTGDVSKAFSSLPLLLWAFAYVLLLPLSPAGSYPRRRLLPPYKRIPLIYQFCSLLN
ncbi:hypothetical protein EVC37_16000 [Methylocaldum sp. BRCS4]|uniref:hypothetical protein n=1 Tax=Methylocaldum sp. 14B TaxID=1912213 RepID=UPI00098A8446|nr:hypothetical protein [Methylocaldum sp. 14B]MVF23106.1 hypothetical protein [Methylocaldum sp. BRCS4]